MTLLPLLFVLLMWFAGTAAVVWLDSRPRATFVASFAAGGVVALLAIAVVANTAQLRGREGAYVGFAAAIVIWAWHEMGFLMGFIAGPIKTPCPSGARGWQRFRLATKTVIAHEVALAATAMLLFAVTWNEPNQAAPLTFLLLFVLRLSAKLNLFLGVANLSDEVFPEHLGYLKTYFGTRRFNLLFPMSIAGSGALAIISWQAAEAAPVDSGSAVAATMIAALSVLGLVEHLFLVLPMRDGAMWRWASNKPTANTTTIRAATSE